VRSESELGVTVRLVVSMRNVPTGELPAALPSVTL